MNKKEALLESLSLLDQTIKDKFKNRKVTFEQFVDIISQDEYHLANSLGYSESGTTKLIKTIFPNKTPNIKICKYILSTNNLKYCFSCKTVKNINEFHSNSSREDSVNSFCSSCMLKITSITQNARNAKRKAAKLNACPSWANLDKIKEIYANCPEGYHVDHIIPLQGINVCGLHIETNLQYLTISENCSKGNKLLL